MCWGEVVFRCTNIKNKIHVDHYMITQLVSEIPVESKLEVHDGVEVCPNVDDPCRAVIALKNSGESRGSNWAWSKSSM